MFLSSAHFLGILSLIICDFFQMLVDTVKEYLSKSSVQQYFVMTGKIIINFEID